MSNRAIERRLARLNQAAVGMGTFAQLGGLNPPMSPREIAEQEQDQQRLYLAAELLKITAERSDDLAGAARAALDAAALIYPELPPETGDVEVSNG